MSKFVKGEHAIAHSEFMRDRDDKMVVVGVGAKYITCIFEGYEDGPKIRFYNDEIRAREDWTSYRLYHSLEEIEQEKENDELRKKFKRDAEYFFFSIEEIKQIYEIHNKNNDAK